MAKAKSARKGKGKGKGKRASPRGKGSHTLAVDVGGSGLKATVLDESGRMLHERVRVATPVGKPPSVIVDTLRSLIAPLPPYGRCSVGFPGMVRDGLVLTAPNLGHKGWHGFDLGSVLQQRLGVPVRVANDADLQGLAVIKGKGLEMVVTLGTGFGTSLYHRGALVPHLEIAHLPFRKGDTFDQHIGNAARKKVGNKAWSKRVSKAIDAMRTLTWFDHLYIGGGNAKHLDLELPNEITLVSNEAGLIGGVALWKEP